MIYEYQKLAAQDVRFDVPLADACMDDRVKLCGNVQPVSDRGQGWVWGRGVWGGGRGGQCGWGGLGGRGTALGVVVWKAVGWRGVFKLCGDMSGTLGVMTQRRRGRGS